MINEEGIDLEDLKQMPLPKLCAFVVFYFKGSFNCEEVEQAINKKSNFFGKCKSNSNEYIIFKFNEVEDFNGENFISEVVNYLYKYKDNIYKLKQNYDCEICLETTFYLTSFNEPYLYLTASTINKMSELNLSFDQAIKFFDHKEFREIISNI